MINFTKIQHLTGVVEQLLNSAGNFLFFLICARVVGVDDFSEFAIIFTAVQMIHGIALQWCFLPVVSYSKEISDSIIFKLTLKKLLVLFCVTPIFLIGYFKFFKSDIIIDLSILSLSFFTISFVVYDFFKFFLIRVSAVEPLILMHLLKWCAVMYLLFNHSLSVDVHNIFFIPLSIIVIISFPYVFFKASSRSKNVNETIPSLNTGPLLIQAIANNFQTLLITAAFTSINVALFGAFIAFRSLLNFLPMLMQYIETHMSVLAVHKGKLTLYNKMLYLVLISISVMLIFLSYIFRENIILLIYGESYILYSYLIPITLSIVIIQCLTRLFNVNLRLQGRIDILYLTSIITVISGLGAYAVTLSIQSEGFLLFILILTPILQCGIIFFEDLVKQFFKSLFPDKFFLFNGKKTR